MNLSSQGPQMHQALLLGGRSPACVRTAPCRVRQQLARGADCPADPLPPPLISRRPLAGLTSASPRGARSRAQEVTDPAHPEVPV